MAFNDIDGWQIRPTTGMDLRSAITNYSSGSGVCRGYTRHITSSGTAFELDSYNFAKAETFKANRVPYAIDTYGQVHETRYELIATREFLNSKKERNKVLTLIK